jgi:AcrR family transcriptional regulator
MPLPRFAKLPLAQQARLLDAATAEFADRGYEGASLNRVLDAAGVSKGALYYYFEDRDDLYAAVVMRVFRSLGDGALNGFDPQTPEAFWPAIEAFARRSADAVQGRATELAAMRSFQRDVRRNPKPAFAEVLALVRERFVVLVRRGRELGCVRTDLPEDKLVELLEAIDEVLDRWLFGGVHDRASARRLAALTVDLGRRQAADATA